MRSDGLIVRAATSAIDPRNALRVARKCVRESLPGEWIVKPMGAESRDFTVRRKRSSDNPTLARAFEMARTLRRHRDVEDCEPALLMPVDGPREMAESKSGSFAVSQSSGTSYATAVVAGTAALWLAYHGRDRLVAKYGVQNLASVFREQLIRHGFDRPLRWDTELFGVGILNAEKLLKAPLPASAMASGLRSLRSTAAPTRRSSVDQIADLFPEATPVAIRKGLSKFLGVSDIHLNREIDDVADEIAYHAATNMRFRELVVAGKISASVAAGSSGTSRALAAGRTSRRSASRTASRAPAVSKQLKAMTGTLK